MFASLPENPSLAQGARSLPCFNQSATAPSQAIRLLPAKQQVNELGRPDENSIPEPRKRSTATRDRLSAFCRNQSLTWRPRGKAATITMKGPIPAFNSCWSSIDDPKAIETSWLQECDQSRGDHPTAYS